MRRNKQYEDDFLAMLRGTQDEIASQHEAIYRQIESDVIQASREVKRVQGSVIAEIARKLPRRLNDPS